MTALAREPGRRVVLVLTDGADTGHLPGHRAGQREVSRRARDGGFMIYAIGMEGTGLRGSMANLTDQTGGGRFELKRDADLSATFARVAEELRRQYLLGFTPTALDGRQHRLEVRLTSPGLSARARRSYLAARPAPRR
jgi:Ca-activated chloride channel family protein